MVTVKQFLKDDLGGIVAVATELGLPVSTVSGWGLNNSIPSWREPALRELAAKKGKAFPDAFADFAA
ncbi:MAG: hypothetical protein CL804_03575 [Citromicrobium sp.]|nr:hypothetical protein [Citromicrobium sp.]|tara:strand:- start:1091 stop:1291 length:201 start_codon:yes stop_codon:yes gene_type:complete